MDRGGYIFSGALHVGAIILVVTGLPSLFKPKEPEITPIAVQLVNLADQTRATELAQTPPKPDAKPEPQVVQEQPKPEPPKPEPPKPPTPAPPPPPPPPPPKPEPAPPPPAPKPPEPKPEPPKVEEKPPEKKEVAEAPKPKQKPEPPKPEPKVEQKPEPPKKQEKLDVDALLKTLKQTKPATKTDEPPKKQQEAPTQVASAQPMNAPLGPQLSTSELDLVRQQISQCWNIPAGAKDAKDIVVEIRVNANPDGTVRDAQIVSAKGSEESFTQAAADSALRAVRNPRCSPLKLPAEKYNSWKTMLLTFNPREML
jgi:outer membrane biosynthesis protein TonB